MSTFPLVLLAGLALTGTASAAASGDLDSYRWRARVLVVLAPDAADTRLAAQRRIAERARPGLKERDLVVLVETGRGARAEALRRRFGVAEAEFRAILVGKDGGDKLASREPIAAERLFAEIDGMPMRQGEMRRQAGPGAGR